MEEKRKKYPSPMSIDEQINNLKEIGLIIQDEAKVKRILNDISYYRLIKAYSLDLKEKNGNYYESITFEHILELYLFDANLRQIIIPQIEKIEINARCRIANYIVEKYGLFGYMQKENFVDGQYHKQFMDDINEEIQRNLKTPFIKNFQENYEGGKVPFYALVEICSFGILSKFYKNMKSDDKKEVAKTFGIGYTYFESWLEGISYVRNICAHYGRIYNAKLTKRPMIYKEYAEAGIVNNRIFAILLCMKQLLKNDRQWNFFVDEIEMLIDKYENIDIKAMGFVADWKKLLIATVKQSPK